MNLTEVHFILNKRGGNRFSLPATYGADLFTIGKNRGRREIPLKVKERNDLLIGCVFIVKNVLRL